jgi:hypothetical protein
MSLEAVQRWLESREPVSSHVFLRAVDWVLDAAGAASGLPSLEPICRRLAESLDQLA